MATQKPKATAKSAAPKTNPTAGTSTTTSKTFQTELIQKVLSYFEKIITMAKCILG